MKFRFLHIPFYIGLSTLCVSITFFIQHWPGAGLLWIIGIVIETIFIVLALAEVIRSSKVETTLKIVITIPYIVMSVFVFIFLRGLFAILLVFILGIVYLKAIRKKVITTKKDMAGIQFDSI